MRDENKPRFNEAAMTNVVLPVIISIVGLGSLVGWFFEDTSGIPVLFIAVTFAPLVWAWMHREDWADRHK